MNPTRFSFPTLIHFGAGVRFGVKDYLKSHHLDRPLIVTDRGIVGLPFFQAFLNPLMDGKLEVQVFSEIWGNPTESQVIQGVRSFKDHQADCIIGLGGGAALDVAKAIALMTHHPGNLFDYEDEKPGALPINGPIPFWIAIPTTSGTGSEVGRSAVISDNETHIKKIIFSPLLLARAVFADPETTLDLPPKVTAATGIDALTHCIEAYLAKGYHPICDGIALEGIRLDGESLKKSVLEPHDLSSRSSMMMASMMGAIAFQKGLGLTHSCAHALSTVSDLHHGLANGLIINHALPHNISAAPDRFKNMASTLGLQDQSGKGFIRWLENLKMDIGIPNRLSDAGVSKDLIVPLSALAFQDSCHLSNPRECKQEDFIRIFTEAAS